MNWLPFKIKYDSSQPLSEPVITLGKLLNLVPTRFMVVKGLHHIDIFDREAVVLITLQDKSNTYSCSVINKLKLTASESNHLRVIADGIIEQEDKRIEEYLAKEQFSERTELCNIYCK